MNSYYPVLTILNRITAFILCTNLLPDRAPSYVPMDSRASLLVTEVSSMPELLVLPHALSMAMQGSKQSHLLSRSNQSLDLVRLSESRTRADGDHDDRRQSQARDGGSVSLHNIQSYVHLSRLFLIWMRRFGRGRDGNRATALRVLLLRCIRDDLLEIPTAI